MRLRRSIATLLILVIGTTAVWACECYNNIPIDRTVARYADRAVFTARVVVPIGAAWRRGDKRFSEFALAIVNERFWGLPWYWPKVVILEGHYPCDNAVTIGKDHLVSGRKLRYGVVDISGCSRTWPIEFAQVDLRTIKGSHCNGPGGTVIGLVHAGLRQSDERPIPYLNQAVTLYDESNQSKRSLTDKDGIFEFRGLAPGKYGVETSIAGQKKPSRTIATVKEGQCVDASLAIPAAEEGE